MMGKWVYWIMAVTLMFGFFVGAIFGIGISASQDTYKYQNSAIMTCEYANQLTNITNMQSTTLEICTGKEYTKLNYLNCTKLR